MPMDKWDPLQDLITVRNRFMELVDRSFREEVMGPGVGFEHWSPPVDFYQDADELVLQVELPGMDRKDIEISLAENQLTVRGERATTFHSGQAAFHRLERQHGHFRRVLDLPVAVDPDKIQATYEDGVLTIRLPLRSRAREKKIRVNTK